MKDYKPMLYVASTSGRLGGCRPLVLPVRLDVGCVVSVVSVVSVGCVSCNGCNGCVV
jgi:hypothetical protein